MRYVYFEKKNAVRNDRKNRTTKARKHENTCRKIKVQIQRSGHYQTNGDKRKTKKGLPKTNKETFPN